MASAVRLEARKSRAFCFIPDWRKKNEVRRSSPAVRWRWHVRAKTQAYIYPTPSFHRLSLAARRLQRRPLLLSSKRRRCSFKRCYTLHVVSSIKIKKIKVLFSCHFTSTYLSLLIVKRHGLHITFFFLFKFRHLIIINLKNNNVTMRAEL